VESPISAPAPWYAGVTRAQWLVLAIASVGWMFDAFEGQLFVASMNKAMPELLGGVTANLQLYNNIAFAAFLLGGAAGGLVFGSLADKIGRQRTMILTILMYSVFTGITFFARRWTDLALLRFFVAMGVGGEWAVAAAAIAEVFPGRARPGALGIFHASSVFGTFLAVIAGATIIVVNWRYGFLLGLLPSLLVLWVRRGMPDPDRWRAARVAATDKAHRLGSFKDLFSTPALRRNTVVATLLAAVGMATFWGVHVYGKDLLREAVLASHAPNELSDADIQRWGMLGMFLTTLGGGAGLLLFAPISQWTSRRGAFFIYYLGAFIVTLVTCRFVHGVVPTCAMLPLFGFLTMGMHAGYAVYFPELFPTRMRASGGGFCFNIARVLAAPALVISGAIQGLDLRASLPTGLTERLVSMNFVTARDGQEHLTLRSAILVIGASYLLGVVLLFFAPETKNRELPQ